MDGEIEGGWVFEDPELVAEMEQLVTYLEQHGRYEWADPTLTAQQAAEAERLCDEALRELRGRD